jgi:hypothetical protein
VFALRQLIMASAVLLACFFAGATASVHAAATGAGRRVARSASLAALGGEIRGYQRTTWRWERVMGLPRTDTAGRVLAQMSLTDVERAVSLWRGRAVAAAKRARRPPHLRDWLCIHHYEGSWTDRGAPYYGGLQMDVSFQEHYGAWLYRHKGTADHWSPLEQMWTAEKALKSRGFWPWPNTARLCGLL